MTDDSIKGLLIDTILMSGFTKRVYYTNLIREHAPKEAILKFEKEHGAPITWNFDTETWFYKMFVEYIPMF